MDLCKRVDHVRCLKHLTIDELSELTGLSSTGLSKMACGMTSAENVRIGTVAILADALGVSIEYLWRGGKLDDEPSCITLNNSRPFPEIRQRIKYLLKDNRMTHEKLAELSGVDLTTLNHTLSGESYPAFSTLKKLAKALGVTPSFLERGYEVRFK